VPLGAGGLSPCGLRADNDPVSEPSAPADAHPATPHVADERRERIRLETPRHRIEGLIVLAADGYRSRVSDVLNAAERDFLTLTDVTLQPLDGGPAERHDFLAVARAHVVYVVAPDERTGSGG
jgi:hypothetical protein